MKAVVWSKDSCTYCDQAKKLLDTHNIEIEEKQIGSVYTLKDLLEVVPNAQTVPQIFLNEEYIGGYTELKIKLAG